MRNVDDGLRSGGRSLVIGCGFIGSRVVEMLAQGGEAPVVLTRSRPDDEIAALIGDGDLHIGDAADPQLLETALERVASVIFCAGGLMPAASEREPELDARLTLDPLIAVLDALRDCPDVELLYISSGGTVYGAPERLPVDESHPTTPRGSYGRLRLACEKEVEGRRIEHGRHSRILRCATVYGERQRPNRGQGAVATFLHRVGRGQPVDFYGEGTSVRDYIYVGDVARACIDIRGRPGGPAVLNLASGEGTSLLDLLRLVESEVNREAIVVPHPRRKFEVEAVTLDPSRLRRLIDFHPTPLKDGIARTHRWLSSNVLESV
jgi:UDP-glucose 4-epimerase